ncbi:Stp1/IreP family PP2C-type Ser/Thr phosphatase [Frisingicoccus sp.]|uniref:Stp1/IreP family PP2C-type Ser/Thr phosphatase n=1 Tax=Frisingicoccus sp. TaxID=1918627 RepID=UPI002EA0A7EF|nr:Stp1/IreP family PP2C-type Ser/Thr phosphatase [Frisingicoccus sp.]
MRVFGKTDVGLVRKVNQDFIYYSQVPVGAFPNLFIVADGMGGHNAGDFASRYAVQCFLDYIQTSKKDALIRMVDEGIKYANQKIIEKAQEDPALKGMGTTMVVAYIEDDQLFVANIGDSRLYLLDKTINQVTEDHSFVATLVRAGELTPEQARKHPDKNIITRAIGAVADAKVDFFEVDLEKGDRIVMCSDGLSNMVDEDVIYDIVKNTYIGDVVDELIEEAKMNGGSDNIAVIVIDPFDVEVN